MLGFAARFSSAVAACAVTAAVLLGNAGLPDPEVARLRAHFAQVERELLARDVSRLTPSQRAARAGHIERLRAYAAAGTFPRNTDFPGRRVPYFVDRAGTHCAMAHLIEQSGAGDYVRRVGAGANNAFIGEIARDDELGPGLRAWLDANGLTLDEAARIQPAYCNDDCCGWIYDTPCDPPPAPEASTGYKAATGVSVVGGLAALALNAALVRVGVPRSASGWLGVTSGLLGLGLGIARLGDEGDFHVLAPLNLVAGVAGVWSGVHVLRTPGHRAAVRAAPWVSADGAAGLRVNIQF